MIESILLEYWHIVIIPVYMCSCWLGFLTSLGLLKEDVIPTIPRRISTPPPPPPFPKHRTRIDENGLIATDAMREAMREQYSKVEKASETPILEPGYRTIRLPFGMPPDHDCEVEYHGRNRIYIPKPKIKPTYRL